MATEAAGPAVVEVRDVSVSFGGVKALRNAEIVLRRHEIHGLIGPNGAGKSTLVGVIAGTVKPNSGDVTVMGSSTRRRGVVGVARSGLARTFQHPALFATLSVAENLAFGERWRRRAGRRLEAVQDEYLDSLADLLGLTPWLDQTVADVPHPVQRLIETTRAMLTAAPVLLVDEPAAGLNETERHSLVAALRGYQSVMAASVLLIEHDVPLVLDTCDRVTVLHEGQVLAAASAEEIRTDQRVIDAYFGAPV